MRQFSSSVVSRSLKYSSTTWGFRALARLQSSLSVFFSVSLGCCLLKLAHQCSPRQYFWFEQPSLPEHFAIAYAKAFTIVQVKGTTMRAFSSSSVRMMFGLGFISCLIRIKIVNCPKNDMRSLTHHSPPSLPPKLANLLRCIKA